MTALSIAAAGSLSFLLVCPSAQAASSHPERFSDADRAYWAFQPIQPPPVPQHDETAHPIDAFITEKLEGAGLKLSPPASKGALLRRASLDLIGLPPAPEELDEFLNDTGPEAFDRAIDRLLASPGYGERWGRHWLDLARFAESEGFKADETRPHAWRYRDYVIRSFNEDKPYDRFVQEQIAGDELFPGDLDALAATGFNRHYPDESNARNLMQRRQEILNDITDTAGAVFLGLTMGCARCHDHKFDPILQEDYYRLQAFFANSAADDAMVLKPEVEQREHERRLRQWEEATQAIRDEIEAIEKPHRLAVIEEYVEKYPPEIQEALRLDPSERTPFERQMAAKAKLYVSPDSHQYIASSQKISGRIKGEARERWVELNKQLDGCRDLHPGELPLGTGIRDLGVQAPATHVLRRGLYDAPEQRVTPGIPAILGGTTLEPVKLPHSTGRRAALAKWLTCSDNPLTARVMVNRIWQYHFGRGLVATASDFGRQGQEPEHPELLDWLASEFIREGWSMKKMHKRIMTSATYRQSSIPCEETLRQDPENRWLSRFSRQRLEGEAIRDSSLAVAGLLNREMEGPSVFPVIPKGMRVAGGWEVSQRSEERNRRSVYVFVRRNTRYPLFEAFDMPDTHESCSRRNVTVSPLQALLLINSEISMEWAAAFASRIERDAGEDWDAQVERAYRLAYARSPDPRELEMARAFAVQHRQIIAQDKTDSEAGEPTRVEQQVLADFCHMVLNSNEFIYRD